MDALWCLFSLKRRQSVKRVNPVLAHTWWWSWGRGDIYLRVNLVLIPTRSHLVRVLGKELYTWCIEADSNSRASELTIESSRPPSKISAVKSFGTNTMKKKISAVPNQRISIFEDLRIIWFFCCLIFCYLLHDTTMGLVTWWYWSCCMINK